MKCSFKYPNTLFNLLGVCVYRHGCVDVPSVPEVEITESVQVTARDLQGDWYVMAGLDKGVDCFPCQKLRIGSDRGDHTYTFLDINRTRTISTSLDFSNGRVVAQFNDYGIKGRDEWSFLEKGHVSVMRYKGRSDMGGYNGGYVLSRSPSLSGTEKNRVMDVFVGQGITKDEICWLDRTNCPV